MGWYGFGWFWWWLAFVIIFFFLPLGYGWGYRGWGPWYRRRRVTMEGPPPPGYVSPVSTADDWGALAIVLWVILIIAIAWLIAVFV